MASVRSATEAVALPADANPLLSAGSATVDRTALAAQQVKIRVTLPDGARVIDDYAANGSTLADQRIYDAAGTLILFKLFDASGLPLRTTTFNADGSTTTAVYAGGLLSKTFTKFTDGSRRVDHYNAAGVSVIDQRSYDASGPLTGFTNLSPNGRTPVITETVGTPGAGADLTETGTVAFAAAVAAGPHAVSVSFDSASSGTTTPLGTLVPVVARDTTNGGAGLVDWTYVVPASQVEVLSVGQSVTEVFDLTLTDQHGGRLVKPVTVTVVGTNDAPQPATTGGDAATGAVSDTSGAPKTSYGYYTATGTLSFRDPDLRDVHAVSSVDPDYSKPYLGNWSAQLVQDSTGGATGRYRWLYQISLQQLQTLAPGETATQDFAIKVADAHGGTLVQTVSIVLTGTPDHAIDHTPGLAIAAQSAPIVEAGVATAGTASATIAVTASDRDPGDHATLLTTGWMAVDATHATRTGTYGSAVLDLGTGVIAYTLDDTRTATNGLAAGETAFDSFAVTDRDTHGLTTTDLARFAVTGTDDAPAFVASAVDSGFGAVIAVAGGGAPVFSPDGASIASAVADPALGPGLLGVFVTDLATNTVTRVSTAAAGTPASGYAPAFSSDGTELAFLTTTPALLPAGAAEGVVLKSLSTGAVTPVLSTAAARLSPGSIDAFALSPDGTRIAFDTDAAGLVTGDTNGVGDVFVKDLATGGITRVSTTSAGQQIDAGGTDPVWSPDGARLVFSEPAENVAGDFYGPSLFIKDLATGALTSLGAGVDAVFSPDGTRLAYTVIDNNAPGGSPGAELAYVRDLVTGVTTPIGLVDGAFGDGHTSQPRFLPDGTSIAFTSDATDLVAGDTNGPYGSDVFIQNLLTGAIARVSTAAGGVQADGSSSDPVVSPDGTRLLFRSDATDLVPGGASGPYGLYLKDIGDTLKATPTLAVTDDGRQATAATTGRLLFTDPEPMDSHTLAVTPAAGDLGTLAATLARDALGRLTGIIDLRYAVTHAAAAAALSAGQSRTDAFTVTVDDGQGGSAHQAVTVAVAEAAPPPAAAPAALFSGATAADPLHRVVGAGGSLAAGEGSAQARMVMAAPHAALSLRPAVDDAGGVLIRVHG